MKHQADDDHVDKVVGEVIEEYLQCCERGEQPQLDEFIEQHPEVGDILETVIPALHATANMTSVFGDGTSARTRQLGDFRILRQIGRGGMGVVYEAEQISMQRRVALKVLPLAGLVDEVRIQRFQNEVRAAAALDHPHIVSIYMVGEERGVHYYAMQLIRGHSLSEVISSLGRVHDDSVGLDGTSIGQVVRRGHLADQDRVESGGSTEFAGQDYGKRENAETLETVAKADDSTIPHSSSREYFCSVVALGIQAASALQHAHDHGIIHRDIKPANLLLDSALKLHLADFGLARIEADVGMTMTGDLIGTLRYMAPEQALAQRVVVDHRADIYSLGVTLYELLALQPAYAAKDRQQLLKQIAFEDPTSLRRIDRSIPVELETIVHTAMSKDMTERYSSAEELANDLRSHLENRPIKAKPPTLPVRIAKWRRRNPVLTWATIIILSLGTLTLATLWDRRNESWAREQLSEISRLVEEERFSEALALSQKVERHIPGDPNLKRLWPQFSVEASIQSDPANVNIAIRTWNAEGDQWRHLGTTPIDQVRLPKGHLHWQLTREDHVDTIVLRTAIQGEMRFKLEKTEGTPRGMVRVAGKEKTFVALVGISNLERLPVGDFYIDRYEVTNQQFQEFVDHGGYASWKYWNQLIKQGESWQEAMAQFVDSTGKPGPAGWESGHYPAGQADYPVCGISWFEAAAYAEFAGKRLPSVYHWAEAADLWTATYIVPLSNFGNRGIAPAGRYRGVGRHGAFDMAGNVKEWCWNGNGAGNRYILGGASGELTYMFSEPDDQQPYARSDTFGFRCVKVLPDGHTSPKIDDEIHRHRRDFSKEEPASDSEFAIYKSLYSCDETPLMDEVKARAEHEHYYYEKIEFDAAYGNEERVIAHLYRPKNTSPPYQPVIYFPPSNTVLQEHFSETVLPGQIAFLVENGRAVLYPIYKGTFDRGPSALSLTEPAVTKNYSDHVMFWYQDLARSIDYLETCSDIQHDRLAYYGYSWGGVMGTILPAVENRIKVAVLSGAGFEEPKCAEQVSQINFAPRVTIPVLMLNGQYNTFFPLETSVRPLYDLLGTPEADKQLIAYDSGPWIPQKALTRETIAWLNKYLGPVRLME